MMKRSNLKTYLYYLFPRLEEVIWLLKTFSCSDKSTNLTVRIGAKEEHV